MDQKEIIITEEPSGRKVKAMLLVCSQCEGVLFSIARPIGSINVRVRCDQCGGVWSDRALPVFDVNAETPPTGQPL